MESWVATCGVCGASYAHDVRPSEAALRAGTFCPNCRDNRRFALGILNWEYEDSDAVAHSEGA